MRVDLEKTSIMTDWVNVLDRWIQVSTTYFVTLNNTSPGFFDTRTLLLFIGSLDSFLLIVHKFKLLETVPWKSDLRVLISFDTYC